MSRKKPIALVVVSALVAGLVAWVAISAHRENVRSGTYAQAASLCREGQYAEAAGLYEQLGDYKLAEEWLVDCNTMLAIESARAEAASLKESGKLEQAQECLREYRYVKFESNDEAIRERARELVAPLYDEIVEARAAGLVEAGMAAEAVQLLRDENVGDSELQLTYDQIADEQAFRAALQAGDLDQARRKMDAIRSDNVYTDRLTGEALDALEAEYDAARERQGALDDLANNRFDQAFNTYRSLGDEDGMRAAIEAAETAGHLGTALCLAIDMGDYERADALYERLAAEGLLNSAEDQGGLKYAGVISKLADAKDEAAVAAIARKFTAKVVEECEALIAEGKRSEPFFALLDMKAHAEPLWTEALQAMMDGCEEALPTTGIIRDDGIVRTGVGPDIATVTVENQGKSSLVFCLNRSWEARVWVFLRPNAKFTFGVASGGDYWASVSRSLTKNDYWFGEEEMFGIRARYDSVVINNGKGRSGTTALIPNPDYTDAYANAHSLEGGESYYASLQ